MKPTRHQRANGTVRLEFGSRGRATVLRDLYQAGCAKAMLPRVHGADPVAVLINTAGGLTGGDRLSVDVTAQAGARVTLATQTAERIYRAASGVAEVRTRLTAAAGAHVDWLAQETILFEGSALSRRLEVDLAEGATALIVEPVILGRTAMGERLDQIAFRDTWRIRRAGRLMHAEATALVGDLDALRTRATLGNATALATVLYLGEDAADRLETLRRILPATGPLRAAASAWEGRLVVRVLAEDAQAMRGLLKELMTLLRGTPPPRVWTM